MVDAFPRESPGNMLYPQERLATHVGMQPAEFMLCIAVALGLNPCHPLRARIRRLAVTDETG